MRPEIESKFVVLGGIVPFDPISEDELVTIESNIGVSLPKEYREFVQTYGAAEFGELVEVHPLEPMPAPVSTSGKCPFSHFYGSSGGNQSLAESIGAYLGRMPDTMIPIGDDGGGNQMCLGVKGEELGKVYYWDHNNEWSEEYYLKDHGKPMPPEVKFQNLYLVANSFEDFILRLQPTE